MSKHIAEVVVYTLEKHPNADLLSIAKVFGWECVIKSSDFEDNYQNLGVYIPSDMVANKDHPLLGFLEGKRIKPIRLRKVFSQGVLLPLKKVVETYNLSYIPKIGDDLSELLQVKRWENLDEIKGLLKTTKQSAEVPRPDFLSKYTDIENYNNYPNILQEGEEVIITEKIDGSCSTYSIIDNKFYICSRNRVLRKDPLIIYVPRWKNKKLRGLNKLLKELNLLRFFGKKEVIPSDTTIWHQVAEKFNLEEVLKQMATKLKTKNIALYGEVVPTQIRGGKVFNYGYSKENVGFIAFDLRIDSTSDGYLSQIEAKKVCDEFNIPFSPVLYTGPFNKNLLNLRSGNSSLNDKHLREGIVIQPAIPRNDRKLGRVILKKKNEDFLLIE